MSDKMQYFAAKNAEETASVLLSKSRTFYNTLESNDYLDKLKTMWRAYHGDYSDESSGHRITFGGEANEYLNLRVNHFRNLAQHMYVMITSNRPLMEARAVNTDYRSMAQTYLANGILDYYMREKGLEDCLKKAAEMAIVLGSGFVKLAWNATAGDTFDADPETGEMVYEGEIEFSNLSPFDVVVDGTKESWNNEWILTRSFQNRFNLIAKYPEYADILRGLPAKGETAIYRLGVWSNDDTDDIPVYEFFHRRTEAMPEGRYLLFADTNCILLDTKMPYRQLPVFRIAPSDVMGTPYGYSPMFDIFPLQEGVNALYSTLMTNNNAFGVQNLWTPPSSNLNVTSLNGSMNVIESEVKPEPLQLTQSAPETYKFLEMLVQAMETISGVNSVARGNPESSLKSGTALALVQSMALQFVSGLQQSYVKLMEDTGTALINILKDFAQTPKVVALVGKNNRTYLKEFTGEQINSINRVVIDVGNPLSRTIAGRVQMAEQLLQMQAIKNPVQYFQVLNTGRLDAMFEGDMSELLLIKSENERLMDGEDVLVTPLDAHKMHILEHKAVLADPDLRKDPVLAKVVMDHVQAHLEALENTDPRLLQLIQEQPLAPLDQMMGGGMPGPMNQPNVTPLNNAPTPEVLGAQQPMAQPGQAVQGPNQEANPLPGLPTPPAPFEQNPVLAADLTPPTRG